MVKRKRIFRMIEGLQDNINNIDNPKTLKDTVNKMLGFLYKNQSQIEHLKSLNNNLYKRVKKIEDVIYPPNNKPLTPPENVLN